MRGFRFQIGLIRQDTDPPVVRGGWLIVGGLAVIAFVVWMILPKVTSSPTAYVLPRPAPTVTVTASPSPSPSTAPVAVTRLSVTSKTGAVCVLPTGLPRGELALVKVP